MFCKLERNWKIYNPLNFREQPWFPTEREGPSEVEVRTGRFFSARPGPARWKKRIGPARSACWAR